jgi:hypothetical protein
MEAELPFFLPAQTAFPPRYPQSGCDFIEQYSQASGFVKTVPITGHGHPVNSYRKEREMGVQPNMTAMGLGQQRFNHLSSAPVLPPIRSNVQLPPMDTAIPSQYRRQDVRVQPEQRPKEEKATGGVAAHLDYDMDQMSEFVAEMVQGMYALYITKINLADIDLARSVYPGSSSVSPQFRKYVHQILSSTRLPSSTILLALYYLATRMRMLSATGIYMSGSGQVYRMLTTALLLGSKFLDDNTFQNRSWAEVSNIPVAELNTMELDWLFAFEWKLHERIHNSQDGFATWLTHWENYQTRSSPSSAIIANNSSSGINNECRQQLAPLDTINIERQRSVSKPLHSPDGPIPPQYQRGNRYENAWLNPAALEYSPPSAPHSGPTTPPDYYSVAPWMFNPPVHYQRGWVAPQSAFYSQSASRSQHLSYRQTPPYVAPFTQSVWTGHGSACGCAYCANHQEHYLCASTIGPIQPLVAG